jgi:hypothetical protein
MVKSFKDLIVWQKSVGNLQLAVRSGGAVGGLLMTEVREI